MTLPVRILLAAMFLMLERPLQVAVLLLVLLLSGCTQRPAEPPAPPPIVNLVSCAAPVGMTEAEQQPERPQGDYTQRDVALYVEALHRWGSRGWLRLAHVREHAEQCAQGADNENE